MTTNQTDLRETDQPQAPPMPAALPSVPYSPEVLEQRTLTLREKAEVYTDKALQKLVDVLDSPYSKPLELISAATAILDRAHGKPTQYVEQTTKVLTYQLLLDDIAEKEKAFIEVIEAQSVETLESASAPTKELSWDDVI